MGTMDKSRGPLLEIGSVARELRKHVANVLVRSRLQRAPCSAVQKQTRYGCRRAKKVGESLETSHQSDRDERERGGLSGRWEMRDLVK